MPYAIDLNKRQSARTLEQAIRHGAEVLLEARIWPDAEPLMCRLEEPHREGLSKNVMTKTLVLSYRPGTDEPHETVPNDAQSLAEQAERLSQLIGSYCDLFIQLGDQVYLCSGDVTQVEMPSAHHQDIRLHLAWTQTLQVAQRRRFHRTNVADSSKVCLSWTRDDRSSNEGIAWLCNISANGLACRADGHVVDRLWIGDQVHIEFTLTPSDPERLAMDAVVCNKTPAGTTGKMIIGMQFMTGPGYETTSQAIESLRHRLGGWSLLASQAHKPEGR